MSFNRLQPRTRRGTSRQNARYVRRDMWRDPFTTRTLPTYYVLDTENGDIIECKNAEHACAVSRSKNREYYRNAPGNWTRYMACYHTKECFRMIEFFEHEVV